MEKAKDANSVDNYAQDSVVMKMAAALRGGSELNQHGVRNISTKLFEEQLKEQGVDIKELKKGQAAVDLITSAASVVAIQDLGDKIAAATDEQRADVEWQKATKAKVRIPTAGGSTTLRAHTNRETRSPHKGEDGQISVTPGYGVVKIDINAEARLSTGFGAYARDTIMASLGIAK